MWKHQNCCNVFSFFPFFMYHAAGASVSLHSEGKFEHEGFARWIDVLPACWDSDMVDKEQGYSLKEAPEARCEWTSIMFQMKRLHTHSISANISCKEVRTLQKWIFSWEGVTLNHITYLFPSCLKFASFENRGQEIITWMCEVTCICYIYLPLDIENSSSD